MAAMMAESYGHRVVALANLLPADVGVEELDSALFPDRRPSRGRGVRRAHRLPLFRRRLRGSSKHTEMTYEIGSSTSAGDEVEDLRALLAAVVEKMPTVRAVTAGAILSDYQRLRVEAVCADLGLVSLAYLWRQPQPLMLETMCASDVDAILVKVAAMGLILASTRQVLSPRCDPPCTASSASLAATAAARAQFETLTLDCSFFRRARLIIQPDDAPPPEIVVTSPDPYAPSGHLAVERHVVALKTPPAPPAPRPSPGAPGIGSGGEGERRHGRRRGRCRSGRRFTRGRSDRRGVPRAPPPRDTTTRRRRRPARRTPPDDDAALPGRAFGGSAAPVVHVSAPSPPRTRPTPRRRRGERRGGVTRRGGSTRRAGTRLVRGGRAVQLYARHVALCRGERRVRAAWCPRTALARARAWNCVFPRGLPRRWA